MSKREPLPRRAVSVNEFSDQVGVNRATTYRWIWDGHLRAVKSPGGGRLLIPVSEIDRFLADSAAREGAGTP